MISLSLVAATIALAPSMPPGLDGARVGDWVTYRVEAPGARTAYWRLAVTGEEPTPDGPARWLDIRLGHERSVSQPLAQLRVLVASDGAGNTVVRAVRVGAGLEPLEWLDARDVQTFLSPLPVTASDSSAARQPSIQTRTGVSIETSAGTLRTLRVQVFIDGTLVKTLWVSETVPILRLVRMEIHGIGHRLELEDFGRTANLPMASSPPPGSTIQRAVIR